MWYISFPFRAWISLWYNQQSYLDIWRVPYLFSLFINWWDWIRYITALKRFLSSLSPSLPLSLSLSSLSSLSASISPSLSLFPLSSFPSYSIFDYLYIIFQQRLSSIVNLFVCSYLHLIHLDSFSSFLTILHSLSSLSWHNRCWTQLHRNGGVCSFPRLQLLSKWSCE